MKGLNVKTKNPLKWTMKKRTKKTDAMEKNGNDTSSSEKGAQDIANNSSNCANKEILGTFFS